MKPGFFFIAILSIAILASCSSNTSTSNSADSTSKSPEKLSTSTRVGDSTDTCTTCIPTDSANKMISSYISSLNGNEGNENLYSLIVDGDELRSYLNAHTDIKHVKLMFAHTLDYINSGHGGQNCGYHHNALTLILAGYDQNNNYIFYNGNEVMNHALPCPTDCPSNGSAASNTF